LGREKVHLLQLMGKEKKKKKKGARKTVVVRKRVTSGEAGLGALQSREDLHNLRKKTSAGG